VGRVVSGARPVPRYDHDGSLRKLFPLRTSRNGAVATAKDRLAGLSREDGRRTRSKLNTLPETASRLSSSSMRAGLVKDRRVTIRAIEILS
jgi:hypothetical protein